MLNNDIDLYLRIRVNPIPCWLAIDHFSIIYQLASIINIENFTLSVRHAIYKISIIRQFTIDI